MLDQVRMAMLGCSAVQIAHPELLIDPDSVFALWGDRQLISNLRGIDQE